LTQNCNSFLQALPERELQVEEENDDSLSAVAFLCDDSFEEIVSDRPLEKKGATVRVCVETGRPLKIREIYIMKLNTFKFYKDEGDSVVSQQAVDTVSQSEQKNLFCLRGSEICSFVTELKDEFFRTDGVVNGVGSVAMQYGKNERRAMVDITLRGRRRTQEFAGMATVKVAFAVEDGWNKKALKEAKFTFQRHWNESPAHVQGLYISGLIVFLLLMCCILSGVILWRTCCSDIRRHIRGGEESEGGFKGENSETHSADNQEWGSDDEVDSDAARDPDVSTYDDESTPAQSRSSVSNDDDYDDEDYVPPTRHSTRVSTPY
jgi:hypothetical protein